MSRRFLAISVVLVALVGAFVGVPRTAEAGEPKPSSEVAAREKSRKAFRKGVTQLRAQDWAGARASFETAWSLFPHPSILLNLGIARLRTDDAVRAEQDLVRFLSEDGGASPEELASAREALADARAHIGTLKLNVSPATARVAIDGVAVETVRRADAASGVIAEVRTRPGSHEVRVESEGYTSDQRVIEVVAKTEVAVTVTLSSTETVVRPPPDRAAKASTRALVGWSLVGLSGAALITSGVTALRAKSLADDYGDGASPRFQDPTTRSQGVTFRTAADVALSVALLSGGAAVILLLTDLGKAGQGPNMNLSAWGGALRW